MQGQELIVLIMTLLFTALVLQENVYDTDEVSASETSLIMEPIVNDTYEVSEYENSTSKDSGQLVKEWGSRGTSDGQFNNPMGIVMDSEDNLYVLDTGNNRIQKFDSNGDYILKWGSFNSGTYDFEFNAPSDIAIDSEDNVYVTDTYNYRILKFDNDGKSIKEWNLVNAVGSRPYNISIDDHDKIDVYHGPLNYGVSSYIQQFDKEGNFYDEWYYYSSVSSNQVNHNTAINSTGYKFEIDKVNNIVKIFSPAVISSKNPDKIEDNKESKSINSDINPSESLNNLGISEKNMTSKLSLPAGITDQM